MTTTLVTGSTGMIGRRLVPLLAERGQRVRAASRTADDPTARLDWTDPTTYAPALEGAGAVFLVPPSLVEDPSGAVAEFLTAARASGTVRKIVAVSSMGCGFPDEPIDSGRRKAERAIAGGGIPFTLLRPGGFMQNLTEGFLAPGVAAGAVATASGDGATAMVDADDLAAVAAEVLAPGACDGETLTLTGPAPVTLDEALAAITPLTGHPVRHARLTAPEFAAMLEGAGMPPAYVAVLTRDQAAIAEGHAAAVTDDVERVLGRRPRTLQAFAGGSVRTG